MIDPQLKKNQSSNFSLKNEYLDLHTPNGRQTWSLRELETKRAEALGLPASKHGLEVICGASCETGAQ